MHVVILDGDLPYPANSGKRLRTLNLMLPLARRHDLTYISRCHAHGPELEQARQFLGDHGIRPILIDDPLPRKSGPMFFTRLLANFASTWPYAVTSHQSAAYGEAVRAHARNHAVDLWQCELVSYLPMLPRDAGGRRIVVAHNVDTMIWKRYAADAGSLPARVFLASQYRKMRRFESWAFNSVDGVVAVSRPDADIIRTEFGANNVTVVDNGMDRTYFDTVDGSHESKQVLFLGALDYRPNTQAVELLLGAILPRVREQTPGARLVIVGRNPPASLIEQTRGREDVELHANVPDVRPFLRDAAVMAVPLRVGGGSRLKILEALAAGLPVVSTPLGAEGLSIEPGKHYVEAAEADFAIALVKTLSEPAVAVDQARRGRAFVRDRYDWQVLADKLDAFWTGRAHRLENAPV